MINNLKQRNEKGFSLVELLLVLGVIAALGITAFMIYPKVSAANNAQTESSNLNSIKATIMSLYSSSPDYAGLNTQVAIDARVFPDSMLNTTRTAALNMFKGAVTVASVGGAGNSPSGAPDAAFTITYNAVPPAECVKLVSAVASNFYKITVDGTEVKAPSVGTGAAASLDVAALSTACDVGNTNIVFTSL